MSSGHAFLRKSDPLTLPASGVAEIYPIGRGVPTTFSSIQAGKAVGTCRCADAPASVPMGDMRRIVGPGRPYSGRFSTGCPVADGKKFAACAEGAGAETDRAGAAESGTAGLGASGTAGSAGANAERAFCIARTSFTGSGISPVGAATGVP